MKKEKRVLTLHEKELKREKRTGIIVTTIIIIFLSILSLAQIFPFYLQIVTSLQPTDFTPIDGKIYLWPVKICFENYKTAFIEGDLLVGLKNTLIVALGFIFLSGLIILIVGYVLAKKEFRGKKIISFILVLTMMVPGEMLMVTNFQLVSKLNWTSSYASLILPGIVNVTGIFLVKSFMDNVPNSVLEAAKLDGANELTIILKFVLPMVLPVMATYFILTFVAQWNDYLWPMLVTGDDALFTIQLKLMYFQSNGGFEETVLRSAALITTLVPVVIVYCCCQKQFVGGLNFSGVK